MKIMLDDIDKILKTYDQNKSLLILPDEEVISLLRSYQQHLNRGLTINPELDRDSLFALCQMIVNIKKAPRTQSGVVVMEKLEECIGKDVMFCLRRLSEIGDYKYFLDLVVNCSRDDFIALKGRLRFPSFYNSIILLNKINIVSNSLFKWMLTLSEKNLNDLYHGLHCLELRGWLHNIEFLPIFFKFHGRNDSRYRAPYSVSLPLVPLSADHPDFTCHSKSEINNIFLKLVNHIESNVLSNRTEQFSTLVSYYMRRHDKLWLAGCGSAGSVRSDDVNRVFLALLKNDLLSIETYDFMLIKSNSIYFVDQLLFGFDLYQGELNQDVKRTLNDLLEILLKLSLERPAASGYSRLIVEERSAASGYEYSSLIEDNAKQFESFYTRRILSHSNPVDLLRTMRFLHNRSLWSKENSLLSEETFLVVARILNDLFEILLKLSLEEPIARRYKYSALIEDNAKQFESFYTRRILSHSNPVDLLRAMRYLYSTHLLSEETFLVIASESGCDTSSDPCLRRAQIIQRFCCEEYTNEYQSISQRTTFFPIKKTILSYIKNHDNPCQLHNEICLLTYKELFNFKKKLLEPLETFDLRQNARTLAQGSRSKSSSLFRIPDEMIAKIAAHTVDYTSQEDAEERAYKYLGRP